MGRRRSWLARMRWWGGVVAVGAACGCNPQGAPQQNSATGPVVGVQQAAETYPECPDPTNPNLSACFTYECTTDLPPPPPDSDYDPNNPYWLREQNPDGSWGALVWSSTEHQPYLPYVAGGPGPFLIPTQHCPGNPPTGEGTNFWPDALDGVPPDGSGGVNCCWNTAFDDLDTSSYSGPDPDGPASDSQGPFDGVLL